MFNSENHQIKNEDEVLVLKSLQKNPVIISVPHDGLGYSDFSGLFQRRKIGYFGKDRSVWPIAKGIAIGWPVNLVRGLMPRTLVDYARAWPVGINYYPLKQKEVHTALDDERLLPTYRRYHSELCRLIESNIATFGKEHCLLIDLHGFSKQPPYAPVGGFDLILGTGNRVSIPHGKTDIDFGNFMSGLGYKVFVPQSLTVGEEEDYYSADFTTRHYSDKYKINAIQIETSSRFRVEAVSGVAEKLSADIAEFLKVNSR